MSKQDNDHSPGMLPVTEGKVVFGSIDKLCAKRTILGAHIVKSEWYERLSILVVRLVGVSRGGRSDNESSLR